MFKQLYYRSLVLYVYGEPVKGTGWNVFRGENAGAFCGMDDFGEAICWSPANIAYGF